MEVVLTPIDAQRDHGELIDFLTSNTFPFHVDTGFTREQAEERIRASQLDRPDNEALWVDVTSLGRVGYALVQDLIDHTPMFDLRLSDAFRGRGVGSVTLRALVRFVFTAHPKVDRFEGTRGRTTSPCAVHSSPPDS